MKFRSLFITVKLRLRYESSLLPISSGIWKMLVPHTYIYSYNYLGDARDILAHALPSCSSIESARPLINLILHEFCCELIPFSLGMGSINCLPSHRFVSSFPNFSHRWSSRRRKLRFLLAFDPKNFLPSNRFLVSSYQTNHSTCSTHYPSRIISTILAVTSIAKVFIPLIQDLNDGWI